MADELTTLGGQAARAKKVLGLAGVAALAGAAALGWWRGDGLRYFLHSYLLNYCFVLSIALGALCFVATQHACRAGWSVTVRRLSELLAAPMPLLAILGAADPRCRSCWARATLYCWADRGHAAARNDLLAHKAPYFNPVFFAARSASATSSSGGC